MKKILAFILAASFAFAMTACGNKNTDDEISQGAAMVDENGNEVAGSAIDGAGKEADIDKVEGTKLDGKSDTKDSAEIGAVKVSIDDAKLTEIDGENIVVVSFTFKNNSKEAMAFDNILSVDAVQNDSKIMSKVIMGTEGINMLSGVELVETGKSTTVQKLYSVDDLATPLKITVYKYGEPGGEKITKTFNLQ